jgi:DNA-binding Xre family transcriptional regulator
MNPRKRVQRLVQLLKKQLPIASVSIDEPSRSSGPWFIDVRIGKKHSFAIEFRPVLGFGLSSIPAEGIGEGPDEFVPDERAVVARVASLVQSGARTEPQRVHVLQELREKRQISQVALAERLGIKQPTVSKIERREDVNLSTLRRFVEALGGKLHVTVEFNDGSVEIGLLDLQDAPASP